MNLKEAYREVRQYKEDQDAGRQANYIIRTRYKKACEIIKEK